MLCSFIGTHGSGKTTLLSRLRTEVIHNSSWISISELTRQCPHRIGEESDNLAQEWIIATQDYLESNSLLLGFPVLSDRALIDQYAYYQYWVGKNESIERRIIERYSKNDYFYKLPANPDFLKTDGIRPISIDFQRIIDEILETTIQRLKLHQITNIYEVNPLKDNISNVILDILSGKTERILLEPPVAQYEYSQDFFQKVLMFNNVKPNYFEAVIDLQFKHWLQEYSW